MSQTIEYLTLLYVGNTGTPPKIGATKVPYQIVHMQRPLIMQCAQYAVV